MSARAGVVLDAGFFIALERRSRVAVALTQLFIDSGTPLVTSAGVIAQVWRGGDKRQVPITFLLRRVDVVSIYNRVARILGRILGETGTNDPIDAHVVLLAREREWPVLTSDTGDLLAIDPMLSLEKI